MKKQIFLIASVILVSIFQMSYAQVPQAFKYQSIVRNTSGNPLANENISIRATVHEGSSSGTTEYQETHDVTTNQFGLINLEIGNGNSTSGEFPNIDWSSGTKWMEIEADFGSGFVSMGSSQLLSVPYALNFVPGPAGPAGLNGLNGQNGIGIVSTVDNFNGTFTFTYSDNSTFTTSDLTGPAGSNGTNGNIGLTGATGNGIVSTTNNFDGTYTFTYTDNSTFTTSDLTGDAGTNGTNGIDGSNGVDGQDGATGATGSISEFAMFYGLTAGTGNLSPTDYPATVAVKTVPGSGRFSFPRNGPTAGIVRIDNTSFTLPSMGTYEVFFSIQVTEVGQVQLELDGVDLPETLVANMNPTAGGHLINGSFFITTTGLNSILAVVNPSGNAAALTITPADGASTHAISQILTIKKIL
jgi:hypothetical protein